MGEVKECPKCSKTISAEIGLCWECWNEHRFPKHAAHHCLSCGIDIGDYETTYKDKQCPHQGVIQQTVRIAEIPKNTKKLSPEAYNHLEHRNYDLMYTNESVWTKLEQRNAEKALINLIDRALAEGDKDAFLSYTNQLNKLKGLRTNAEV